jgi:hypothetical protein
VWRDLRDELRPAGLEVITVSLDSQGTASRRWIAAAAPTHPSLIDRTHKLARLFGVTNVPSGIWIDEAGTVVRPAGPAFPGRPAYLDRQPDYISLAPHERRLRRKGRQIGAALERRGDYQAYPRALRNWVARGNDSPHVVKAGVAQNAGLTRRQSLGEAHFELGLHLLDMGRAASARRHLQAASRLHPASWTIKRQSWSLGKEMGATPEALQERWLRQVSRAGAENYYPALDL